MLLCPSVKIGSFSLHNECMKMSIMFINAFTALYLKIKVIITIQFYYLGNLEQYLKQYPVAGKRLQTKMNIYPYSSPSTAG